MNKSQLGQAAETEACEFLQAKGFVLLQKNYRSPFGEIDLIMQNATHIVFVEVRSRNRIDYGRAQETINQTKIAKLRKTAQYFLQKNHCLYTVNSRFDVIAINRIGGKKEVEWIPNAFN